MQAFFRTFFNFFITFDMNLRLTFLRSFFCSFFNYFRNNQLFFYEKNGDYFPAQSILILDSKVL